MALASAGMFFQGESNNAEYMQSVLVIQCFIGYKVHILLLCSTLYERGSPWTVHTAGAGRTAYAGPAPPYGEDAGGCT